MTKEKIKSGPWLVEYDDSGGPYIYHKAHRVSESFDFLFQIGHPTELAAWEYVLECLVVRRDVLSGHIKESRDMVRKLSRKKRA